MRRLLFDENIPRLLRHRLTGFEIRTVQEEGWGSFSNGELLRRAEGRFDVMLTADRRMQYQQKLTGFGIGIVVIVTPRLQLPLLETAIQRLQTAIETVTLGEIIHVTVASPHR